MRSFPGSEQGSDKIGDLRKAEKFGSHLLRSENESFLGNHMKLDLVIYGHSP